MFAYNHNALAEPDFHIAPPETGQQTGICNSVSSPFIDPNLCKAKSIPHNNFIFVKILANCQCLQQNLLFINILSHTMCIESEVQ